MTHTLSNAFGDYETAPSATQTQTQALYVTMRDGVKIALDLHLPAALKPSDKIPAIVISTRYWRARSYYLGGNWFTRAAQKAVDYLVWRGYAIVQPDARGTGASFGTRRHPWDPEEIKDGGDLVQWIIEQPWSNGKVGSLGTSYAGTSAELLTVPNHPAVKAVIPRFNEFDIYADIFFPGGIYLKEFVEGWSAMTRKLDYNIVPARNSLRGLLTRGVKPVDGDPGRNLLQQALEEHKANIHVATFARHILCRDDRHSDTGISMEDFSVHTMQEAIERSGAAIYGWGSWFDGTTADTVIRRYLTFSNPQIAVIGPWNHGATQHASPYAPGAANVVEHWNEYLRFFDHYLKDSGSAPEKMLTYYTVGEEKWKQTPDWPPAGVISQRWYFAEGGVLSSEAPATANGEDIYTVDFDVTTGSTNRWSTEMSGGPVLYPDRSEEDKRLLTYTSQPLEQNLEITGYPIITLYLTSTASEGTIFAYLEDVTPEGHVLYLVEGLLHTSHRKISANPPYKQLTPYHSFKRADLQSLVPGEMTEITFGLMPISVLIRKGHRIRIAIAGADKSYFPRVPASGTPELTIARNNIHASCIDLPIMQR